MKPSSQDRPDFSIITPSFNMLPYLRRCHASIRDQGGVSVEHIVADGGSTDGTLEWLREQTKVRSITGPDEGMYDAINKGMAIATGRIVGYLNCDEQYLPGALEAVKRRFEEERTAEVVYGDALVVGMDGGFFAYRKAYRPIRAFILTSHLYLLTCALFWTDHVAHSEKFDIGLKDLGDADFVLRLLEQGRKFSHCRRYLSTFGMTGSNRSLGENAKNEARLLAGRMPLWLSLLRYPVGVARLIFKALSGCYFQPSPITYDVFVESLESRSRFVAPRPTFRWPKL